MNLCSGSKSSFLGSSGYIKQPGLDIGELSPNKDPNLLPERFVAHFFFVNFLLGGEGIFAIIAALRHAFSLKLLIFNIPAVLASPFAPWKLVDSLAIGLAVFLFHIAFNFVAAFTALVEAGLLAPSSTACAISWLFFKTVAAATLVEAH